MSWDLTVPFFFSFSQITEKQNELGKLEAIDCGKPLDEALADLVINIRQWKKKKTVTAVAMRFCWLGIFCGFIIQDDVIACFEYYAGLAEGLDAKQKAPLPLPMETFRSYVLKEPIGVVALITPW